MFGEPKNQFSLSDRDTPILWRIAFRTNLRGPQALLFLPPQPCTVLTQMRYDEERL